MRIHSSHTLPSHTLQLTRRGLTLVELLIVIAVLVTMTAVLIPTVKFVLKDRKIRESTRVVDSFVTEAQTEAMQTGMSGIWIERDENSLNTSTRIYKIKSPPPYTGDYLGAMCQILSAGPNALEQLNGIDDDGIDGIDNLYFADVRFDAQSALNSVRLVQPGDLIQFDFKGPWFTVLNAPTWTSGNAFTSPIRVVGAAGPIPVVGPGDPPLATRFKVIRMPKRASASYIDMPDSTMIDLSKSGLTVLDLNNDGIFNDTILPGYEFSNVTNPESPILIIFGEDGTLELVVANGVAFRPDRSIHLLLATDERQSDADFNPSGNIDSLENLSNFWLTITRQGAISTTEVADVTPLDNTDPWGELLRSSRRETRKVETTGGG